MPTLSNNIQLTSTGSTDRQGNPIYSGSDGALYTSQAGRFILSRPATFTPTNNPLVNTVSSQTASNILSTQKPSAYDTPSLAEFRGKSEEEIGAYYDKSLELLAKQVATARRQATEKRDLGLTRSNEDETSYMQHEDIQFSRALSAAQSGYAGRGTFTSGFRNKDIGAQIDDRETSLGDAERAFLRGEEDINNAYTLFDENLVLDEESKRLALDRARESDVISRQRQLASEENQKRAVERATQEEASKNFVRERLS